MSQQQVSGKGKRSKNNAASRYILAFTNNNQTILLDSLTGQFQMLANPFPSETIQVEDTTPIGKANVHILGHLHVRDPVCGVQPHGLEDVQP